MGLMKMPTIATDSSGEASSQERAGDASVTSER
jgi:hypothetical protein